ncbi:MAG: IS110 family transposase [Chthoniobacteraceae bacterium]
MTPPLVHLGLDVAKATLAGHLAGASFTLENTPAGHAALVARIVAYGHPVHVVCEATGGYERPVVAALRAADRPVSVLHPTRVRQLARGLGYLAKNDPLDAAMLARVGALLAPESTPAPPEGVSVLAALVTRRDQLAELLRREKQHRETTTEKVLLRDLTQNLAALQKRLEKIEALIEKHLQTQPALAAKAARLQEAPGVGFVGAVTLLAFLPELGQGSAARLSSLAGLAPRDHDSGNLRGPRHVHGGRPKVRRILYLCALSAARHHPALQTFHTRLRTAGKPPKVALIATARKLLTHLHAALKNPHFSFA